MDKKQEEELRDLRTAQRYMKAYENRDKLKNDTVSHLQELV